MFSLQNLRRILAILTILMISSGFGVSAYSVPVITNTKSILNESAKYQKDWDILLKQFVVDADAAPKGSTIRIATFLWDTDRGTDAVIRAFKRGVYIRFVIDPTQTQGSHVQKLRKILGTDRSKTSFAYSPTGSGLHHSEWANIHAKIVTFSQTGNDKNVSYNGSSNINVGNLHDSSNETQRRANDLKIYTANAKYVDAIVANKEQHKYYSSKYGHVTSGSMSIVYYPGAPDVIYNRLKNFDSKKACKGVRIDGAVFQVSNTKQPTLKTKALLKAAKNGCDVNFVYNYKPTRVLLGVKPATYLFAKKSNGSRWIDIRNGLTPNQYVHNKELLIRKTSVVKKKTVIKTWVYAGSSNWLSLNMQQNADFVTINTDRAVYNAYFNQWGKIWNHSVAPVFPVYDPRILGSSGDPEPEYDGVE